MFLSFRRDMAELPPVTPATSSEAVLKELLVAVSEIKVQLGRQQEAQTSLTQQVSALQQKQSVASSGPTSGSPPMSSHAQSGR